MQSGAPTAHDISSEAKDLKERERAGCGLRSFASLRMTWWELFPTLLPFLGRQNSLGKRVLHSLFEQDERPPIFTGGLSFGHQSA